MKKFNKNGFTLTELTIVLAIGGTLIFGAVQYYNHIQEENKRVKEARSLLNYSRAVSNLVINNQTLFLSNKTSSPINTLSYQQLINYGFANSIEYSKISEPATGSLLYPCSVIFYDSNKLQGFVYYRTDNIKLSSTAFNYKKDNSTANLSKSLDVLGQNGGILTLESTGEYILKGKDGNWKLSNSQVNTYLVQSKGNIFGDGLSSCAGKYIAIPSYTISINKNLDIINSELKPDNTVKQNSNELINSGANNDIKTLNLDSTGINGKPWESTTQNKLIFQINPNCVMDPSILSTMQDYDPNESGGCPNWDASKIQCRTIAKPNKWGCRNKQLTLGVQNANICNYQTGQDCDSSNAGNKNIQAVVINGFNEVNTKYNTSIDKSALGGLNADTIQATAQVGYGDPCSKNEIGSLAQQKSYAGSNMVEKLYNLNQNLLVCQKSLLCDGSVYSSVRNDVKKCWLPVSSITAQVNFSMSDKILGVKAPNGFYIKSAEYYPVDTTVNVWDYGNNKKYGLGGAAEGKGGSATDQGICKKHYTGGWWDFGTCNTETNGDIMQMPTNITQSIGLDGNVNVPYSNVSGYRTIPSNYGFEIMKDTGSEVFDFTKYFKSCVNGDQNNGPCVEPTTDYNNIYRNTVNQMYTYKAGITFPYLLNPKFSVRQTRWRFSGNSCQFLNDCDPWKAGKILSMPQYVKNVVFSNNTDELVVDSSDPQPAPPIPNPPSATCNASSVPSYISSDAWSAANNYKYDHVSAQEVIMRSPNNYVLSVTNANQYSCKVTATADYCPKNSTTNCKYSIAYQMGQGCEAKFGGSYMGGTFTRYENQNDGSNWTDEVWCAGKNFMNRCTARIDKTKLNTWVEYCQVNTSRTTTPTVVKSYTQTTVTAGSCTPNNQCTNPLNRNIYTITYNP